MIRILLDTNACAAIIRDKPPSVRRRLDGCEPGEVGISVITYCELEYGVSHSRDPQANGRALVEFIAPLEIVDLSAQVAATYGRVRAGLRRAGTPIGPLDMLIAAHALFLGATLVTNNVREFKRVPGLKVEDWVKT